MKTQKLNETMHQEQEHRFAASHYSQWPKRMTQEGLESGATSNPAPLGYNRLAKKKK